ncbi:hypothetical protein EVA_08973 [gut metagenome]|uniref:Uncharacterized protein n=1 Tax=gut metagenome TaxID=749906 RepID=J9GL76_9ZZZZ
MLSLLMMIMHQRRIFSVRVRERPDPHHVIFMLQTFMLRTLLSKIHLVL